MVIPLDPDVITALETTNTSVLRASAFYGDSQTVAKVPLYPSGQLSFDGTAQIPGSGTAYLNDDGASYVPREVSDPFAPFGQELSFERVLLRGDSGQEDVHIPLGRFRIVDVPSMAEYFRRYPTQIGVNGWSLQLTLRDRMDILANDDFLTPTAATAGGSTWAEIRRVAPQGLGIAQSNLPDVNLPAGITYQSLPDAITKLMGNLGGVPHMTRDGLLTARQKDRWLTATVPEFTVRGTVDVGDTMSNKLYNCVVASNPNSDLVAIRQILDETNPLWVGGPLGRRVYKFSDPLMTTQAMLNKAAETALARVSSQQAHTVTFAHLPRPDLELGDFGDVIDDRSGYTYRGEIASLSMSLDQTQLQTGKLTIAEVIRP